MYTVWSLQSHIFIGEWKIKQVWGSAVTHETQVTREKGEKSLKVLAGHTCIGVWFFFFLILFFFCCMVRFHLHELIEETIYCPFRCLLHRQSETKGGHHQEIGVLDLKFNVHVAVKSDTEMTSWTFIINCKNIPGVLIASSISPTWIRMTRTQRSRMWSQANIPWLQTWSSGLKKRKHSSHDKCHQYQLYVFIPKQAHASFYSIFPTFRLWCWSCPHVDL